MSKWRNPLLIHYCASGRGGAALPVALKLVVKKQPASVEHGLHFPGKTWGSVKEKLSLDSAHTNSKIEVA